MPEQTRTLADLEDEQAHLSHLLSDYEQGAVAATPDEIDELRAELAGVERQLAVIRRRKIGAALDARFDSHSAQGLCFGRSEFDKFASEHALTAAELYDQLGSFLAIRYHTGQLSWEACDLAVNALFGLVIDEDHRFDETLFWRVYLAFDAGEFHRTPDKSDDPEAEHTRPAIGEIVRDYRLS